MITEATPEHTSPNPHALNRSGNIRHCASVGDGIEIRKCEERTFLTCAFEHVNFA
jgi:hypothetical protein